MEEKVDILLTTYNTNSKFLKEQIDSILNQTHKNISLLISDDCSTKKEVRQILEEYSKKDNRIVLFFQEKNIGCTKGFEFLLKKSTADYIAFSDHDDIWYEDKIEESLKTLKEKGVSLVYCDARQINSEGNVLHDSYLKYKNMPILNKEYKKILPFSRHIAIGCSQLFTKEVKELMLPFTKKTYTHDWHSLYIASKLNGVYCINKPLFDYRLHDGNIFGGRSFKENIRLWKKEYGNSFKSYQKYRHRAITDIYLAGALMCKDFRVKLKKNNSNEQGFDLEDDVINYYKNAQNSKILYLNIFKYYKYLYFKGIGRRKYKEIMLLHFPLLSFIVFKLCS